MENKKPRKPSASPKIKRPFSKKKKVAMLNNKFGEASWYNVVQNPTGPMPSYTPETLWNKFLDYLLWTETNPLYEVEARAVSMGMNMGSDIEIVKLPKMRALTIRGFCVFAGIVLDTFMKWRAGKSQHGNMIQVTTYISDVIYTQKFEGAAAGLLNALIISRDLGLTEKTVNENINNNSVELTKAQILEISKSLDAKI